MKRLIIINGPPASGKTTVLKRLFEELGWTSIVKDEIKEKALDETGKLSKEDNFQLSEQVFETMFEIIDEYSSEGEDLIVEGNLKISLSEDIRKALEGKDYQVLQIFCHAEDDVLTARYIDRTSKGGRHPGHGGALDLGNTRRTGQMEPLDIDADLIDYDNSNNELLDYDQVSRWVDVHSSASR